MFTRPIRACIVLFIVVCSLFFAGGCAHAEEVNRRVTITPFLQTVVVPADQPVKTFTVQLTNSAKEAQEFRLSTVDFGTLEETGGLVYAGVDASTLTKKYGLASWLELDQKEVKIESGQSVTIEATIRNDVELSPGGHYAAIIAEISSGENISENTIQIKQKISSLVFATKTGGEAYSLSLTDFSHNGNIFQLPSRAVLTFKNNGNVHVIPRGTVAIKNVSGDVISRSVINESSVYVLPESTREIAVELKKNSSQLVIPGKYRVEVAYRYDGYEGVAVKIKTMLFISWMAVAVLLIIVSGMYFVRRVVSGKKPLKKSKK